MASDPQQPPNGDRPLVQQINAAPDNGFLGLTGWMKGLAQLSAVTIMFGLSTWLIISTLNNDRADRAEDRTLFREAIKDLNGEQNRRAGEIKGSVDKNTEVMRDLINEFRNARHVGAIRPGPEPKAIPP